MNSRSVSRHNKARMKKRARAVLSRWHPSLDPAIVGSFADNLQKCSCVMCGNPRRFYGKKTREEMRSDLDFEESVKYK